MLKTLAKLEHKIGDRIYHLVCSADEALTEIKDTPLDEVKIALSQFMGHLVHIENTAKAQQVPTAEALPTSQSQE